MKALELPTAEELLEKHWTSVRKPIPKGKITFEEFHEWCDEDSNAEWEARQQAEGQARLEAIARQAAEQRAQQEADARQTAEQRAQQAESELQRIPAELEALQRS